MACLLRSCIPLHWNNGGTKRIWYTLLLHAMACTALRHLLLQLCTPPPPSEHAPPEGLPGIVRSPAPRIHSPTNRLPQPPLLRPPAGALSAPTSAASAAPKQHAARTSAPGEHTRGRRREAGHPLPCPCCAPRLRRRTTPLDTESTWQDRAAQISAMSSKSKYSWFSLSSPSKMTSVSLMRMCSGSSPYCLSTRASSAVYFIMTSAFSSW